MREDIYETRDSKYCYENTNVLINTLDIKDKEVLYKFEKQVVLAKLFELRKNEQIGNFDIGHFLRNS